MERLVVPDCCFCFDLRTGSLIIGYKDLLTNVFVLGFGLGIVGVLTIVYSDSDSDNDSGKEEEFEVETESSISLGLVGLMVILNLLFVIAFLVGMYKYKRSLVGIYIVYYLINIAIAIIALMYSIIVCPITIGIQLDTIILFNIALNIYFVIVIRSYYLIMPTRPPQAPPQGSSPTSGLRSANTPTSMPNTPTSRPNTPTSRRNTPKSRPNTPTSSKPNTPA